MSDHLSRSPVPTLAILSFIALQLALPGCGGNKTTAPGPTDTTPPAAVTDLAVVSATSGSLTLGWTAPGDDGGTGTATQYDIRYSISAITAANWAAATAVAGEPAPRAAGQPETFTVPGLSCDVTYHFALKTQDEVAGQWSGLSNAPGGKTSTCGETMVLVAAGSFTMGSPDTERGRQFGEKPYGVTLTKPFYISMREVTQAEWEAVMGWNDSEGIGDGTRPVEQITWFDAVEYCNRKSEAESRTAAYAFAWKTTDGNHIVGGGVTWNGGADGYRLPTEAEWEFACRGGTTTAFATGGITNTECSEPNLNAAGWYCGNSGGVTHPVGQKQANPWGLKDMHGNVQEWCWDLSGAYPVDPVTDPTGPVAGTQRVTRGGHYDSNAGECRSAARSAIEPGRRYGMVGVRVVRGG